MPSGGAIGQLRPLGRSNQNLTHDLPERATDPIESDPDFRLPFSPPRWASEHTGRPGERDTIGHGRPHLPPALHRQADRRPPAACLAALIASGAPVYEDP